jgi:predicted transcriptional regulator
VISNGVPLAIRGHLLNFFKVTIMKKNWTEQDIEQLTKLVDKKTNTELSHIFNVSNSSIEHVLQRYNLKRSSDK